MFTVFDLTKGAVELTARETGYLQSFLQSFSSTECGAWLASVPWRKITFRWCPAMTVDTGVMGAYSILHPRSVFLMYPKIRDYKITAKANRPFWVDGFLLTVIHELRHCLQHRTHPVLYLLGSLPLIRRFTIERDAERAEAAAYALAREWSRRPTVTPAQQRGAWKSGA